MNEQNQQKEPPHLSALATIAGLEEKFFQLPRNFQGKKGDGDCVIPLPAQITTANSLNEILVFARKQAAADVHLCIHNPVIFRKHGLLTVDSRVKERKKYGQKAARRKFQFVKR